MRRALLPLALAGCAREMPPDLPCREAGYAIAARTEACTGDPALAADRFADFEDAYTCVEIDAGEDAETLPVQLQDLFQCSLAIRNLPCELVLLYDDDLEQWMGSSPMCRLVAVRDVGDAP